MTVSRRPRDESRRAKSLGALACLVLTSCATPAGSGPVAAAVQSSQAKAAPRKRLPLRLVVRQVGRHHVDGLTEAVASRTRSQLESLGHVVRADADRTLEIDLAFSNRAGVPGELLCADLAGRVVRGGVAAFAAVEVTRQRCLDPTPGVVGSGAANTSSGLSAMLAALATKRPEAELSWFEGTLASLILTLSLQATGPEPAAQR